MSNKQIVLDAFVRVGDIVVVDSGDNDRSFVDLPPQGTEATAVEVYTYNRYIGRDGLWIEQPKPGIYETTGAMTYEFMENGALVRRQLSAHHLVFKDPSFDRETRRGDDYWKKATDGVYIGPLPELPFYVGDYARQMSELSHAEGKITAIDYYYIDQKRADGSPMPIYGFRPAGPESKFDVGEYRCEATELTLIRRGNYYWWEHDKAQLAFTDLAEEAAFYSTLGLSEQLRSPASGNYRWTKEDAIAAIANGEGDVLRMSGGMFGTTSFPTVYRFPTLPDLGKRLREETCKGFEELVRDLRNQGKIQ